ncbi:hypothetical protein KY342_01980 [Candidatus Woesearchaeota archaeon]|nr:hypothetical protein [Candidatus Woesearchaeota archaeon]
MSLGDILIEELGKDTLHSKGEIMKSLKQHSYVPTLRFYQGKAVGIECAGDWFTRSVVEFVKQADGRYKIIYGIGDN